MKWNLVTLICSSLISNIYIRLGIFSWAHWTFVYLLCRNLLSPLSILKFDLFRIESPEVKPCQYGQLILDKWNTSTNGGKIASLTNGVGRSGQIHAKKNETRPPTYTIHKNKIKVDKRLKYKS